MISLKSKTTLPVCKKKCMVGYYGAYSYFLFCNGNKKANKTSTEKKGPILINIMRFHVYVL